MSTARLSTTLTECQSSALMAAGAFLLVASCIWDGGGHVLNRVGLVAIILGATAAVACRVRKLTADDIERARQEGFDAGYDLGCEVRPQIIDLDAARARSAFAERGASQ